MRQLINESRANTAPMVRASGFSTSELGQLYGGALATTFIAILMFTGVWAFRGGLGDQPLPIIAIFILTIFPTWLMAWTASLRLSNSLLTACVAAVAFFLAVLWPIVGLYFGPLALMVATPIICVAILHGGRISRSFLRDGKAAMMVAVLLSAILLIALTSPTRLFLPEAMLVGNAPTDSYFHASLAQMVLRYGRFSTGSDGLDFFRYHFLSHVIAAGFSRSSDIDVPHIYLYWGAITLKIQFIWASYFACLFFFGTSDTKPMRAILWRFIYVLLMAVFLDAFESESFVLGLTCMVAVLPLLLTLPEYREPPYGLGIVAALLMIAALVICATAKVSTGLFGAIALLMALWHHRRRAYFVIIAITGLIILATFAKFYLLQQISYRPGFRLLAASYFQYVTWSTAASYILPLLVILIFVRLPRMHVQMDARMFQLNILSHSCQELETGQGILSCLYRACSGAYRSGVISQFLLLSVCGCLLILVTMPIGSNMAFFSLILYNFALILLPAALEQASSIHLTDRWLRWVLGSIIAFDGIAAVVTFVGGLALCLVSLQQAATGRTSGPSGLRQEIIASLRSTDTPFALLRKSLEETPVAKLDKELRHADLAASGKLAVSITPAANDLWYWLASKSPYWCMAPQLIIPSMAGIAELRSFVPQEIEKECSPSGLNFYVPSDGIDKRRSAFLATSELCRSGATFGVRRIYLLSSIKDLSKNKMLICGAPN